MRILKGHTGPVRCLAYHPDGQLLASGGDDRSIKLWDITTSQEKKTLICHDDCVRAIAFSPDGKQLVSAAWDDTVRRWHLSHKKQSKKLERCIGGAWSVAYSPDGTLVSGDGGGFVCIYLSPSLENPDTRLIHDGPVNAIAFDPLGKWLFTASHDGTIRRLDGPWWIKGEVLHRHDDWVRSLTVAPSGALAASCADNGIIDLWTLPDGKLHQRLTFHSAPIGQVAFTPDGATLLSVGWDGTAHLWDVACDTERAAYSWQIGRLLCLAIAPDGMTAATGGENGEVVIWDLE